MPRQSTDTHETEPSVDEEVMKREIAHIQATEGQNDEQHLSGMDLSQPVAPNDTPTVIVGKGIRFPWIRVLLIGLFISGFIFYAPYLTSMVLSRWPEVGAPLGGFLMPVVYVLAFLISWALLALMRVKGAFFITLGTVIMTIGLMILSLWLVFSPTVLDRSFAEPLFYVTSILGGMVSIVILSLIINKLRKRGAPIFLVVILYILAIAAPFIALVILVPSLLDYLSSYLVIR